MEFPSKMDPYAVLNIRYNASPAETKSAFKKKIYSPDRYQRGTTALAYDMLCSRDPTKYTRVGNKFTVNRKDHFYYVTTGDYASFIKLMKRHKSLLNETDELGRTLLYIAARNGFYNICKFLLKSGCNVNETQRDGSTALHAATYYGHQLIVELLLQFEANPEIENNFGNRPLDEADKSGIRECILSKAHDKINILLNTLIDQGLAKNVVVIKYEHKIIGKKILRTNLPSKYSRSYLIENWTLAWHGTKYKCLESIMQHGLYPAGSSISGGYQIAPQAGHIGLNRKVGKYENWANAVFVSPSIFYAADVVYAERIFSEKERWCVLVEARVRPDSFTKHNQTLLNKRSLLPGEPENLEYRVAVKNDEDLIMRVESNRNIIVTGLLFVKQSFLDDIDEYYEGDDLFANSDAERSLFQV